MTEPIDEDEVYRYPATEKWDYKAVFSNHEGDIDASPQLDFYAAAQAIVIRLVKRETLAEIEGMAALYLFRHYLELVLKNIVYNARALESKDKRKPSSEVQWPTEHDLLKLWKEAKTELPKKLGKGMLRTLDYEYAGKCIEEFHSIDSSSERLRYGWSKKQAASDVLSLLRVDWDALSLAMLHVHDVLEAMDSYLDATHDQIAEWEAILDSMV